MSAELGLRVDFHNDLTGLKRGVKDPFEYTMPRQAPLGARLPEIDGGTVVLSTDPEGMREAGMKLVFGQIFPLVPTVDKGYTAPKNLLDEALMQQGQHDDLVARFPNLRVVDSVASLDETLGTPGKTGIAFGIEGMDGWDGDFGILETFWKRGIRSIGTNWNNDNAIGTGCKTTQWHGLTDIGRDFVKEAANMGFLIDVSHASRQTAVDIMDQVQGPQVFASHTASSTLVENPRNLDDDLAIELARRGSVVGVAPMGWMVGGRTVEHFVRMVAYYKDFFVKEGFENALVVGTDFNGMAAATSAIPGLDTVTSFSTVLTEALVGEGLSPQEIAGIYGDNGIQYLRRTFPKTS